MLAVGYNLASIWQFNAIGKYFYLNGNPQQSLLILTITLLPVFFQGFRGKLKFYIAANIILMPLLLYAGVLKHVFAYYNGNIDLYYAIWTWAAAITVNVYGVFIGVMASIAAFKAQRARVGR